MKGEDGVAQSACLPASGPVGKQTVPLLLTVGEVAELLAMSTDWVYEHGAELGLVKLGGANRYVRSEVEAYVASLLPDSEPEVVRTPASSRQGSPRNGRRRVALLDVATPMRPGSRHG